jgi:hypothetical protein
MPNHGRKGSSAAAKKNKKKANNNHGGSNGSSRGNNGAIGDSDRGNGASASTGGGTGTTIATVSSSAHKGGNSTSSHGRGVANTVSSCFLDPPYAAMVHATAFGHYSQQHAQPQQQELPSELLGCGSRGATQDSASKSRNGSVTQPAAAHQEVGKVRAAKIGGGAVAGCPGAM